MLLIADKNKDLSGPLRLRQRQRHDQSNKKTQYKYVFEHVKLAN